MAALKSEVAAYLEAHGDERDDEGHVLAVHNGKITLGAWMIPVIADRDCASVWVDGVHFNVRLEDDRVCTLVMIGARADGTKELIAVEDGYREAPRV